MTVSERQKIVQSLEEVYLLQLAVESAEPDGSDTESDAGSPSSPDYEHPPPSATVLSILQQLYPRRHLNERLPIVKDGAQLRLTLTKIYCRSVSRAASAKKRL
ncbi:hypothetical protein FRB97_006905 [Tulasnella sp. 331]|nr:hypothetical protein FRB97_006905 [Tulasnella sp. 331]